MSRASKITLGVTSLFTATMIVGVHYVQQLERETLHQGPIKDAQRMKEKRLARENAGGVDPEKERQRMVNKSEHEYQLELRKKYEQMQPLSGEVRTKDDELVELKKWEKELPSPSSSSSFHPPTEFQYNEW